MGEISEYLKERYTKNHNSSTRDMMGKQKIKNAITRLCEEYLKEPEDELTFEVLPNELTYAIEVILEEPLHSNYIINQISETLFTAHLRELDIGL